MRSTFRGANFEQPVVSFLEAEIGSTTRFLKMPTRSVTLQIIWRRTFHVIWRGTPPHWYGVKP
jgi:hypothetical protein